MVVVGRRRRKGGLPGDGVWLPGPLSYTIRVPYTASMDGAVQLYCIAEI